MADGILTFCVIMVTFVSCGWAQTDKEYTLVEEQPANTEIGNLTVDLGLDLSIPPEFHKDIKYQFLQQSDKYKPFFNIRDATGYFTTKAKLDRETLCPLSDTCIIYLDISILPSQYFQIFKLGVRLTDINDNIPTFSSPNKSLQISETTAVGTVFAIPAATDGDSSLYGIQRYLLEATVNNFALDDGSSSVATGAAGPSDPRLVLKHGLDREANSFYSLKVLAVDGGTPAETGTIMIEVTVTDANDNPPKFDKDTYQISIEENTPINREILQVQARDTDQGENGRVTYTFSQSTQSNFGHLFSLNPQTGSILVKGQIDYDNSPIHQYTLSVVASDSALSDYATVNVFITDVNDNAPEIILNMADGDTVEIGENSPLEAFVTHISVIDPDLGKGGEVACQLNHDYFNLVKLNTPKQYKIVTASSLNREVVDHYYVTLSCEDSGQPSALSTTQVIKIVVTDENDHSPVFQRPFYVVQVYENSPVSNQIVQVKATDRDLGENARITFSILKPNDEFLSIDAQNGFIWTRQVFDYEYKKSYEVIVMATDNGVPSLSANVTVNLTVMDVNDEAPKFNQSYYIFGTYENQPSGTEIGVIEATDLDSPPFSNVIYTIDIHSPDASVFKINDPSIGKITSRKVLDREQQDSYTVLVIASNPGYSLNSVCNVTVFVGDENDNPPKLMFPTTYNHTAQVSSYATKGHLITKILAHDDDVGRNSYLHYSILAGNIQSIFMINPNTGEIFVNKSLESFKEKDIKLSVLVKDRGTPPLSAVSELQIYINSSQLFLTAGPVQKSTTNIQLIIILCLSLLAIALFLAVLIVIVKMKRKKSNQTDSRYKVDISVSSSDQCFTNASLPNSVDNSPIAVRKEGKDSGDKPPPYSVCGGSPNRTFVPTRVGIDPKPEGRKVHFATPDTSYDSVNKDSDDHNTTADSSMPYIQLQAAGRPAFLEQQRQRLLYRSPTTNPTRSQDQLHVQSNADLESDQGSSNDSGRGQSDDEHACLNSSSQAPNISYVPNPPLGNKHNKIYPDLVRCVCAANNLRENPQTAVHSQGCPQHQSPKHHSGPQTIDNLNDFQNLLGLPPKTYNKKHRSNAPNNLNVPPRPPRHSDGSAASRHLNVSQEPLDSSYSSNNTPRSPPPHTSNNTPHSPPPHSPNQLTNTFTQQCYDDIARKKNNSRYGAIGSGTTTSSNGSRPQRSHRSRDSDSWQQRGEESEGGESDGGSTTTSGSFSVIGSVENVQKPVQQIHQVYV